MRLNLKLIKLWLMQNWIMMSEALSENPCINFSMYETTLYLQDMLLKTSICYIHERM